MNYAQLVIPKLNVTAQFTRCLAYVQDAFGSPNAGPSASYAWGQTKKKHYDQNFPSDVYYLAWFEYWGTVDGVYDNWGHVVIGKDGVFYSSPYTNKNTHDVIGSLSEVERIYGCKFVGWSEDIAGLNVIEGEEMTQAQANDLAFRIGLLAHMPLEDLSESWITYHGNNILANPEYAAALATQLYNGSKWQDFNYKGIHYDEDTANSDFVETKVYIKK